jgi:hypothetical protein
LIDDDKFRAPKEEGESLKFNCWNDDKFRAPDEEGKSLRIQLLK